MQKKQFSIGLHFFENVSDKGQNLLCMCASGPARHDARMKRGWLEGNWKKSKILRVFNFKG